MHDLAGVQKFSEILLDEYLPDGVDVLVNNAGMMWPQKDDEPSPFNKDDPVPKVTQTTTVNAIAPTLLTTLLQPDMRTISVIPDPTELNFLSYPVPLDLSGYMVSGVGLNSMLRYLYSKRLLCCAMSHLTQTGQGGEGNHVLLSPGSVATGIHRKNLRRQPFFSRVA